jgi:hypothetical protein
VVIQSWYSCQVLLLKRVQARTGGGGVPPTNDGTIRNRFFVDICSLDEWIGDGCYYFGFDGYFYSIIFSGCCFKS